MTGIISITKGGYKISKIIGEIFESADIYSINPDRKEDNELILPLKEFTKVLFEKYKVTDKVDDLEFTIGEELLRVHRSYLNVIMKLKNKINVKAFSHITGGGIIGNTKRVVPEGMQIKIDWSAWQTPPIFELIAKTGSISEDEMREVFNLGIGLIAIVNKNEVDQTKEICRTINENVIELGVIV